jgi:hypothetical protein
LSSGVAPGPILSKLIISYTVSGTLSFTTLDGVTTSVGTLPVGTFMFDVQFTAVTWSGTAVAAGFFTQ